MEPKSGKADGGDGKALYALLLAFLRINKEAHSTVSAIPSGRTHSDTEDSIKLRLEEWLEE